MTESSILEAQISSGSLFPPAPEETRTAPAKKRAAKKTAKKASAKKVSTKKTAAAKPAEETPLIPVSVPAPAPAPAKAEAATATAKPAKKASRTSARKTPSSRARASAPEATGDATPAPTPAKPPEVAPPSPPPEAPPVRDPAPPPAPQTTPTEPVQPKVPQPEPTVTPTIPSEVPSPAQSKAEGPAQGDATVAPRETTHPRERERERGGRFRNKWDKRNKRFRERNGNPNSAEGGRQQAEGGQQSAPPPERPLGPPEPSEGLLEMTPKGYGYLRQKSRQYAVFNQDPWVSPEWIRSLGLREGMYIKGVQQEGHRGPQVTQITEVNGMEPDKVRDLPLFEELKAINPNKRIQLETRPDRLTTRVMDLITPLGRGQRGLIVAPPRAGKTTLLQHIAEAVSEKHPDLHLMILLVDERPEEVTEFRRTLPNAEIHASSNDSDVKSHMRTASFAIERAKRLVEAGQHVFMLLDSITRMGRAFNNAHKGGATMSGGVGVGALELPRRLFAAARNTRDAGSLTILATTLIETNSRMDELIFQEFKGTGNLELVLDRKIAEQYIYPAVNIFKSGTRREELLLPAFQMEKIHLLRRGLAGHKPIDAIQRVITLLERSPNNAQMLVELPGGK